MKKILIIDDDYDLALITSEMLQDYNYQVDIVQDCKQAFDILTKKQYHLIVLDINLPDGTGFEVCKQFRDMSQVPVIFASARTNVDDKIKGLDMGGDDYLEKPYALKELLSRINALMRRTYGKDYQDQCYHFGDIVVDIGNRRVYKGKGELKLSLKEFDVLAYLCAHPEETITKEKLLQEVWGAFCETEISTIAVHIRWLREKLETDPASPQYIQTIWGIGYRFHMIKDHNDDKENR